MNCDWCGGLIEELEQPVPGYNGEPTHNRCRHQALTAQAIDRGLETADYRPEREPFTDWPNGQGTYD